MLSSAAIGVAYQKAIAAIGSATLLTKFLMPSKDAPFDCSVFIGANALDAKMLNAANNNIFFTKLRLPLRIFKNLITYYYIFSKCQKKG